jgi:hypothetical protein
MTPANAERQRRSYDAKRLVHCCDLALALSGISVALVEILVAVIAGNFLGIHATTDWINFLALLGTRSAHVSGQRGNRSPFAESESARKWN